MADNWQLKAVLSANAAGLLGTLKSVNTATRTTRKYLSDVAGSAGNLAGRLGLPLGILSGVAGGFSINAIKNAMVGLADLEDEVSKFSATTGIAGAEYKKFQYLAKLSNVPFEALTGTMSKLNKGIYDAGNGKNKDLAALFVKLKIPVRDAAGELRSAAEMLPELADAFKRNENINTRSAMGMAMFGKSWREVMPLLAEGSQKINERMARFRELGLEVKDVKAFDAQMAAAGRFGDRLDDLNFVAKGFQTTIASQLLPVIEPLINDMIKWIVANKELVATEVKAFVKDLADGLRSIDWKSVAQGARDFVSGLKSAVEWIGGAKNALIALVLFMNIQTIAAFVGLIASVGRLGLAMAGLALKALAPVAPLQTLTAGMTAAQARATMLVNTMGRLAAAGGVAGVAFAAWELGTLANDGINFLVEKATGKKGETLGGWLHDKWNPEERPSLIQQNKGRVEGQVNINIANLPPGSRVEQPMTGGNMPLNVDAGYSSYAMGMP